MPVQKNYAVIETDFRALTRIGFVVIIARSAHQMALPSSISGCLVHLFTFDPSLGAEPICIDGKMIRPALDGAIGGSSFLYLPETGLPSLLHFDGSPVEEVNSFLRFLRSDGVSLVSVGHYAGDLHVFARYLREVPGKSLLEASSADVGKYRALRLEGPGEYRLSGASWKRASAALTRFYRWASDEAGLIQEAPKTRFLRDGATAEDTIRMISLEEYLLFRNNGLLGQARSANSGPRRNRLRDAAFAELLVTTGVRLQEGASLLIGELPSANARIFDGCRSAMVDLPAVITKGRKRRAVPYPRRVASDFIDAYVREERSRLVDRWRRAGGARTFSRPLIGVLAGGSRLLVRGEQRPRTLASLRIDERRNLILLPEPNASLDHAQPAALWLAQDGAPLTPAAWQSIFRRASKSVSESGSRVLHVSPHMLRHTFAVSWLSHLIKAEVTRLGSRPCPDRTEEIYMKVVGDPLRRIQSWLGHSSVTTTQKYLTYADDAFEIIDRAGDALDRRLMGILP